MRLPPDCEPKGNCEKYILSLFNAPRPADLALAAPATHFEDPALTIRATLPNKNKSGTIGLSC